MLECLHIKSEVLGSNSCLGNFHSAVFLKKIPLNIISCVGILHFEAFKWLYIWFIQNFFKIIKTSNVFSLLYLRIIFTNYVYHSYLNRYKIYGKNFQELILFYLIPILIVINIIITALYFIYNRTATKEKKKLHNTKNLNLLMSHGTVIKYKEQNFEEFILFYLLPFRYFLFLNIISRI